MRFLYWLGLGIGIALTAIGLLAPVCPQCELPNHFRPFILLGALVLVALAYLRHPGQRPWIAIALAGANLALLVIPSADALMRPTPVAASNTHMKLVSFNLWGTRRYEEIEGFLHDQAPDVVMLQELQRFHLRDLLPRLQATFPHQAVCAGCGVAILSKTPLRDADVAGRLPLVTALWTAPTGETYRLVSLHIAWPFQPERQAKDVDAFIATAGSWSEPVVMAGDFNMTPWSWGLNKLAWQSGLRRQGTFAASWPVANVFNTPLQGWPIPPLLLIDNVLTSPQIVSSHFDIGPELGSDHRPISVSLQLP